MAAKKKTRKKQKKPKRTAGNKMTPMKRTATSLRLRCASKRRPLLSMEEPMSEKTFTQSDVDRIVSERLARDRQVRVSREPRTYALDSPYSFYADVWSRKENPQA